MRWRWIVGALGVVFAVLWWLLGWVGLEATSAERDLTLGDRFWWEVAPMLVVFASFGLLMPSRKAKALP